MSIICSDCGHDNSADAQFCDRCGSYLNDEISTADKFSAIEEDFDVDIATVEFSSKINHSVDELDETAQHGGNFKNIPSGIDISTSFQVVASHPSFSSKTEANPSQAVLVDLDSHIRYKLPSNTTSINIGRKHDRVPIHVDLTDINHADLISRFHAAIQVENGNYYLEDMGSANGTWLNGQAIEPGTRFRQQLHHGDIIAFGRSQTVKLTFCES